jgi:hypothetical protein
MVKITADELAVLKIVNMIEGGALASGFIPKAQKTAADLVDQKLLELRNGRLDLTAAGRAALAEGGAK